MGLSATYSVTASGGSLTYQWFKNGQTIAGATGGSYVTPPTAFTDSGSQFTVTVSNGGASLTSTPASLTVTARAPNPQDLRFQLVDNPATVNGWGNIAGGELTAINGRLGMYFYPAVGMPLWLGGTLCSGTPLADGGNCDWNVDWFPAPSPGLLAGYTSDVYTYFPADLQSPAPGYWPWTNGVSPASGGSVVNSLDLEPATTLLGLSWIQDPQQSGYELAVGTVDPADLQTAVAQQGQGGRVVTAISGNNGQITFLAYGWQNDTTTVYETQVVTASLADVPTAAAGLAQQGYIITAFGSADASGVNMALVGTRVAGDTMPRPFLAPYFYWTGEKSPDYATFAQQGYAVTGVVQSADGSMVTFLVER